MKISVEYKNNEKDSVVIKENMSYLAFIKHTAFKGLGGNLDDYQTRRFLRYFVEYQSFFDNSCKAFKLPFAIEHDVTEKNYMSHKIGKAIADFLAKKICNAKFTLNYEIALAKNGSEISENHPDLYCFNNITKTQFSVRSKGVHRRTMTQREVEKYSIQPKGENLLENISVTSATYNIYNNVHVKLYDPTNAETPYLENLNNQLIEDYYNNIRFMLESFKKEDLTFTHLTDEIKNNYVAYKVVDLYRYELASQNNFQRVRHYWKLYSDILNLHILVHKNIINYSNQLDVGSEAIYDSEDCYIDLDGIGICILNS